jgi:PAS domain S-box-containing protein
MANLPKELLNRRRNPKLVLLWIYLLIGLVVCVVGGAMAMIYFTGLRMAAEHGSMMDAAEIKLETATAHLWFEELLSGDKDVTIDQVTGHIDQADWYANAMLEGGENPQGKFVALTDPNMRENVKQVQKKLGQFKDVTLERWQAKDTAGIGSEIEQRYDAIFSELQTLADKVKNDVKVLIDQNLSKFAAQQVALVIISLIVTITVSVAFGRFVFRQIEDEKKLIALNQQLDATNQQLRASEQQLQATNQQLSASEQQLKASNQQLIANEQQFKAANQQLMASEQQLRASNQQLMANEKRLRQSQRELREQRDRAQKYLDVAGVMFVVLNSDGDVTLVNTKGCEILAYSEDEVIGKNWFDNFLPQSMSVQVKEVFGQLMDGKLEPVEYYENPVLTKDGRERIIAWHNTILRDEQGQITGILSSGTDITERKRAEDALKESERRIGTVIDQSPVSMELYNLTGFQVQTNRAWEIMWDANPEDAIGKFNILTDPQTKRSPIYPQIEKAFNGHNQFIEEWYFDPKVSGFDARARYMRSHIYPNKNEKREIQNIVLTHEDITDRKWAEEALRESEKRFREFAELLPEIVCETDEQGVLTFVNYRAYDVFGYSREDMEGKLNVLDILVPEDHARGSANIKRVLDGEELGGNDYTARRKDGSTFPIMVYSTAILCDGKPAGIRAIIVDITRQKEAERQAQEHQAQFQHVSRLSTVGEMASGLAHELNQPLSAIMSYANASLRTIKDENADVGKISENLEMVALQSKRAGEIIRRIRDFVRKQKPNREKVDTNKLVKEVVSFVQADIRSNKVELKLSLARKISKVNADSIQIEQVLLNLIRNAIEAMAESKTDQRKLTIRTSPTKSKCIEFAVSDSGHGLDDEILAQVFEPFFTTKAEGLGIGLSISRSIVEAHGGTLSAKSNPEGGTTFKFTLPITK